MSRQYVSGKSSKAIKSCKLRTILKCLANVMTFLKPILIFLCGILSACAANVSLTSSVETTATGARLSYLDIAKFDRDLSIALKDKNNSVEVAFFDKVSPNNVPDRLQKWISVIDSSGGKVLVEPPPNEFVSRSPMAALSLIGTLISTVKTFAKFNSERIYETAKGRDAVISLERNNTGQVVIKTIKFVNQPK